MSCSRDLSPISSASPLESFVCSRIGPRIPDCSYSSCCLRRLQFVTVVPSFLVFLITDIFEEDWSVYSAECSSIEFLWCFLMLRLGFWIWGNKRIEVKRPFSLYHVRGLVISTWCFTGDALFDHLLKVVSARFFLSEVTNFLFTLSESVNPAHSQREGN